MKTYWRHLKLPLFVTVATLIIMTFVGTALIGPPQPAADGNPERASSLGQTLGILTTLMLAPFWVYGVLEAGKERRRALKNARPKSAPPRRKNRR